MRYGNTDIKKMKCNKHTIEFLNRYWETSNSWGHETEMFIDGQFEGSNRIRYYNRTWECYRFQSCMIGCVENKLKQLCDREKERYKGTHGIKRMTEEKRKEFEKHFNGLDYIKTLNKAIRELK